MEKKLYSLFFTIFFTAIHLFGNTITVKGYVKHADGSAVANSEVKIAVYLANGTTSCAEQAVITNSVGFYSKELSCTGDIRRSRIAVKNCDGAALAQEKEVPVSKIVEANFTVCQAPTICVAKFTGEPVPASSTVPAFSEKFNSSSSELGIGDHIFHRTWDFHDGTALLADRVDPIHSFPHAGTYEVCLMIKTSLGCESKVCKQIIIQPHTPVTCAAKFTFEKLGPKKFRFNSSLSTKGTDDNIIERKWDFRDGSTSSDASPAHEFSKSGTYEVCLNIKTAKGCESRLCAVVKVEEVSQSHNAEIQITSLYPTPAHENIKAVIHSAFNNVNATISIVDEFGVIQSSKRITFIEGYNPISILISNLTPGSYFIRVATQYGIVSKLFFKL